MIAPTFASGALIAGRYRLEARLGAGGGGTVWRCSDEKLAMTVALKIIGSEGELERWRREVATARRIADRNVCRVHDLGEADGVRFVTMEFVDGTGLRAKIGAGVTIDQARDLFAQVVSGVAAIHGAGVVHRDIKPDNVVVATDGRAVIVDFGLARDPRAADERAPAAPASAAIGTSATLTHEGAIVGTPRYMSPEQAAGETVDARTDVWALGLIGHELVTGTLPPVAGDGKGRTVDADALTRWPAIVPILRRCLATSPADRYPDAGALRDALAKIVRRRPTRALVVAAGAVALAGLAGVGIMVASKDGEQTTPTNARAPLGPIQVTRVAATLPASVAVTPDAKELAYTTADGRLFVDRLGATTDAGKREWKLPVIAERVAGQPPRDFKLVTSWAVGWFRDHSVALASISAAGTWHLLRIYEDGRHSVLYSTTERFTASAAGDIAVIGAHENAIYVINAAKPEDLEPIARLGGGEMVMALAVSPDATRVAVARVPPGEGVAQVQIITLDGAIKPVWRDKVVNDVDGMVVWLDEHRIAFGHRGKTTTKLLTYDEQTGEPPIVRREWPAREYVGIASAARGELLFIGGRLDFSVAAGGPRAEQLEVLHDPALSGDFPAGWTSDGRLVFSLSDKDGSYVVSAVPGGTPERWPGLTGGEIPNSVVGDDVIIHRIDKAKDELVIERVTAKGARTEVRRAPDDEDARYLVRCAGDRTSPCFFEETTAGYVTWRTFSPHTGEVGGVLHKRLRRERHMQTAALSVDGKTLAIVEGTSELLLVDVATESVRTIDVADGAELQTVGFADDGSLWATAMGFRGNFFALLRFSASGGQVIAGPTSLQQGSLRFFWRPSPSPHSKHVAVKLIDFTLEITRLTGV